MTFLSYAQNFEDVMLWRALRTVERGFYIDIGAAHPDIDSVTRAFYDRGWSGINIEPVANMARRLTLARVRDITLQIAVGETAGPAELFVVDGTGLSTLERTALPAINKLGYVAKPVQVEMTTLAELCSKYAPDNVHFLKIDVEGAEAAVLRGADFSLFRPWIVLVESTAPTSMQDTSGAWDPILLQAGYQFVYFDGLNRFYVVDERYEELAPSFYAPPNVFDDFLRIADTEWARRVADAQAEVARMTIEAREAAQAIAVARARSEENIRLQQAILSLQATHQAALKAAEIARFEARDAADWLASMRRSTSWRVTAPLRQLVSIIQAVRRRASPAIRPIEDDISCRQVKINPQPVDPQRPVNAMALQYPASLRAAQPSPLRRAVHQFHSGSAVGDAVTNAMLLTRTLLRQQGYASEIFVEHLDPLLADELRPMEELPIHTDYVLIVRHSMGYNAFDRVAELPAPKILIYHNITPEALFNGDPETQRYCRLGRAQLAQWRPLVVSALADSEFNAVELRCLGFDGAQACTLLFDIAALRVRAADRSSMYRNGTFTILFVGRIIPSKGQDDLVTAYAGFRRRFAKPSRLILVGRHDGVGSLYFEKLRADIQAQGLAEHVTLTDFVSATELHAWYSAADLYVSLSRHEGFGVPIIEAMAYDLPVLALPSGAVPYTMSGTGEILCSAAPEAVAAAMLALAQDPAQRAKIAERQRRSLDRFALDRQMRPLMQALAQAGAAQPDDSATRNLLDKNMRVTIAGHVNKSYSLAAINRSLALAIEAVRPGSVRICPVEGQPTHDLSQVPEALQADIVRLVERPKPDTGPEMVISQHYPVFVPEDAGDVSVALFFWEESMVPAATISQLNRSFRGVLAPSRSVAKALTDSGLSIPVHAISLSPNLDGFRPAQWRDTRGQKRFNFLHVSSGFPRKGIDVLMAAFARAFSVTDPVRLVIKIFPNPHNDVASQIERLRTRVPELAEIVLIDEDISQTELLTLYKDADAVVLPTRGEGFNIPAVEAMAAGIPLIVTGFGGHMDFCTNENARLLHYRFVPSKSHLAAPHSLWVEPDEDDLVSALREAVSDRSAATARTWAAQKAVAAIQDRASVVRRLTAVGVSLVMAPQPASLRIGWVSTWQVRCGIAGYSQALLSAMPAGPKFTILCDTRTQPEQTEHDGVTVQPAWRLGDAESLPGLMTAIAALDPQVLVVQHQPALLPWGTLGQLLKTRAFTERIVVITLHNTRNLLNAADTDRHAALAALAGVARIIVHTVADINFLKDLGLVKNVTMMPHGAPPRVSAPPPRRLTTEDDPIIACYGFFLPDKGIGALIQAVAILSLQWPKIRLRLVNADYGTPEAADEIGKCRALANELGVSVEWHTEFLPNERSLALLGECDVVVLPYQQSQEASSAALRTALSAGSVVAVTKLALFEEAADAVFQLSGCDPNIIAESLARLLVDEALRLRIQQAASCWLVDHDWSAIGIRLHGMLTGLTRIV